MTCGRYSLVKSGMRLLNILEGEFPYVIVNTDCQFDSIWHYQIDRLLGTSVSDHLDSVSLWPCL